MRAWTLSEQAIDMKHPGFWNAVLGQPRTDIGLVGVVAYAEPGTVVRYININTRTWHFTM